MNNNKYTLITGSTGYLGLTIVKCLLELNLNLFEFSPGVLVTGGVSKYVFDEK